MRCLCSGVLEVADCMAPTQMVFLLLCLNWLEVFFSLLYFIHTVSVTPRGGKKKLVTKNEETKKRITQYKPCPETKTPIKVV